MPGTTAFPAALDTFPEIEANTSESAAGFEHDVVHNNEAAAIAALQAKVGIDGSADPTSIDAKLTQLDAEMALAAEAIDDLADEIAGKADVSHTHAAADITSGLLATARVAAGTATPGHVPTVQVDGSLALEAPSGGGSGDVATDAIWDAAGDLAIGTGSNTADRLAVGSDGHVLTVVSGVPAWAAPSGGGGGYGEGTSFPGSPSTDDKFYRTDRNILYFYDGTRWLSVTLYRDKIDGTYRLNESSSTGLHAFASVANDYAIFIEKFGCSLLSVTADVSNYATMTLQWVSAANSYTSIASVNNQSAGNVVWVNPSAAVNAELSSSARALAISLARTGTPGLVYYGPWYSYRLIG